MRQSAEVRREEVIAAALAEFSVAGYKATSTEAIARRVGVSQPYLFRLFPTKHEIFLAATTRCVDSIEDAFRTVGKQADLATLGRAYRALLDDKVLAMFQLQAWAVARSDPDVRELCRVQFVRLWRLIQELAGADYWQARMFLAEGVLLNLLTAVEMPLSHKELQRVLVEFDGDPSSSSASQSQHE